MGKYKSLSIEERLLIAKYLSEGKTPNAIAKNLGRTNTTISREIQNHSIVEKPRNDCLVYLMKQCTKRNACGAYCKNCMCKVCRYGRDCNSICSDYTKSYCDRLLDSPHVCNGCPSFSKDKPCKYEKSYYDPSKAHEMAKAELHDKRAGFDYTEVEIKIINKAISQLIINGSSPYAALKAREVYFKNKGIEISKSTLYRLIDSGLLKCRNINLHERVKRRQNKRKKYNNGETYAVLTLDKAGHLYGDFLKYMAKHDISVVEMDCIEGKRTDKAALLTLHFKDAHFQLAKILDAQNSKNVVKALDEYEMMLGYDLFCEMFPVILTNNGSEFADIAGMERSCVKDGKQRTKIFFCEPNRSDQKGSCERNHREIRKIIPKGTTLEPFYQVDINLMVNHLNSYVRPSLHGKCPYDIATSMYPEDFFLLLGLEKIQADKVMMTPHLFDYKKKIS